MINETRDAMETIDGALEVAVSELDLREDLSYCPVRVIGIE